MCAYVRVAQATIDVCAHLGHFRRHDLLGLVEDVFEKHGRAFTRRHAIDLCERRAQRNVRQARRWPK